jgi:DeoR/GlpR family transcriptional regulator of sugar metabolism
MKIDRLSAIRQHLYAKGSASIAELVEAVDISVATLRRDLVTLESQGAVERVHGGARLAQAGNVEVAFEQRESANLGAKRLIADAAHALLRPHTTIFLDAGTTVLQLARRLRLDPVPLTAVTNGLPVAQELLHVDGVKVMMLGGELRPDNASLVGPHAESQLDRMHFDQLFLGAGAIGEDLTITTADLSEASLNARMLARSRQRVLLADSSKFDRTVTYVVSPLGGVTHLVAEAGLPMTWKKKIANLGIELILAGDA